MKNRFMKWCLVILVLFLAPGAPVFPVKTAAEGGTGAIVSHGSGRKRDDKEFWNITDRKKDRDMEVKAEAWTAKRVTGEEPRPVRTMDRPGRGTAEEQKEQAGPGTPEWIEGASPEGPPEQTEAGNPDGTEAASPEGPPEQAGPDPDARYVALTFDDGPSANTARLLDCLEANGVKATFFLVGTQIAGYPEEIRRMEELGCEIGNHSYNHSDLTRLSAWEIQNDLQRVDAMIYNLVGHNATVVRPPYGNINSTVRGAVSVPVILWSIDTLDWQTRNADSTVSAVLRDVRDGDIVLMHDLYAATVDAAEILIPELIRQGYTLVTVHELARARGREFEPGVAYGSFHRN